MSGEGGSVDDRSVDEVATSMRRLLAAIDEGELPATPAGRHYLAGAIAVLDAVAQAAGQAALSSPDSDSAT